MDTLEKHLIVGYHVALLDFIYNRVTALWGLSEAQHTTARRCTMYGVMKNINREISIANIDSTLFITEVILLIISSGTS